MSGKACDAKSAGYLQSSPGFVDSLTDCSTPCKASPQCKSVTLYASKWCSHFSTTCAKLVDAAGATTIRFQSANGPVGWALAGGGKACDSGNGEVHLSSSPGNGGTLAQCLVSCRRSTTGCKSITFFRDSWCSHFSTACGQTKDVTDAISFTTIR